MTELIESYLRDGLFRVRYDNEYSEFKTIHAGVPQGSVLGPVLYLLFTSDLPQSKNVTTATFADDTAILSVGRTVKEATTKLQEALDAVSAWTVKWRIKLNENKSI